MSPAQQLEPTVEPTGMNTLGYDVPHLAIPSDEEVGIGPALRHSDRSLDEVQRSLLGPQTPKHARHGRLRRQPERLASSLS